MESRGLRSRGTALARRLLAYSVDCAILFGLLVAFQLALILTGLHPFVRSIAAPPTSVAAGQLHLWVSVSTTLPFAAYFAIGFSRSATLGQRLLGLRVTALDGGQLRPTRSLIRAIVLLLPFELNHAVMFHALARDPPVPSGQAGLAAVTLLCGIYIALPLIRPDERSVHDLVAGSHVDRPAVSS